MGSFVLLIVVTRTKSAVRRALQGPIGVMFLALCACEASMGGQAGPGGNVGGSGSGSGAGSGSGNAGTGGSGTNGGSAGTTATGGSGNGPSGGTTGVGGTAGSGSMDCNQPQAAVMPARVLSDSQYDNSILDVLKVTGNPSNGFGPGVDDIVLEQRANVAAAVATQAAASLSTWAPCTPPASGSSAACEQQIIDRIGAKFFRHALSQTEQARFKTLFDAGIREKDFATGVEWLLTGVLQSPDFMYEIARPAPSETPGEVRPLAPNEYANRLAFFIWDGPSDDALDTAAANGELDDPVARAAQVARMMADQRFNRGLTQFYWQWLSMKGFAELARDIPEFDQTVVTSLSTSLLMSATELYKAPNPNITGLFSGDTYYLNDALRGFYGVTGTGSGFAPVSMSGQSRRGVLTHPALMALLARPGESFPIGRGLHLLRTILCITIEAPTNVVITPQPPQQQGVSTRQRLEMHTANDVCQGCHGMINPAGFAFESFDEVGRFRTMDHGVAVDSSGVLETGSDVDGAFATGDELLAKLGDSQRVRACFAEKYLDFAVQHLVSNPADTCSIQALGQSFGASGDLKELVVSVAQTDSFRMRLAEGVGQ